MLCTPICVLNVTAGGAGRKLCTPSGTRVGYAGRVPDVEKGPRGLRRGRGARERILSASQQLFRDQGINGTGIDQLCAVAEVSKRTLYQHFSGKDELIAEHLRRFDPEILPEVFDRTDLSPRERLLAAFDVHAPLCPFIAAAVEIPDPGHPARVHARDYKKAFAARLTDTAREAGATHPEQLGEQLALLLDGASARSRVLDSEAFTTASAIAAVLVDNAIPTAAAPAGASAAEQHGHSTSSPSGLDTASRNSARPNPLPSARPTPGRKSSSVG
jgi:AcrR family transcriptional regulator